MQDSPQKKGQQQPIVRKTGIITRLSTGLLLASLLVLSFVAAIPLLFATNNNAAYAQTSGVTLNIECVLDDDGSPVVSWGIDNIVSIKPATGGYGYMVLEGDEPIDWFLTIPTGGFVFPNPIIRTFEGQMGQEYTLQVVYDDNSLDLRDVEVIASKTVTCPLPLTEQFQNQGQCIREANTNPSSGITKADCKTAFKA